MEGLGHPFTFFTGEFEHAIDEKGRVTLPALYRRNFPQDSTALFVPAAHGESCVRVFSEAGWALYDSKYVEELNEFDARGTARRIASLYRMIEQARVDKGGRVTLPARYVKKLGLSEKVVMAGHRDHFEIWDPDEYERFLAAESLDSEDEGGR